MTGAPKSRADCLSAVQVSEKLDNDRGRCPSIPYTKKIGTCWEQAPLMLDDRARPGFELIREYITLLSSITNA